MDARTTKILDRFVDPLSLGSRIWLTAFDDTSIIVARETHPGYFLHGGWIELVDEPQARVDLGARRIEIELRDSIERVRAAWSMHYDSDGALLDAYERTSKANATISLAEQLAGRLRWILAPG